MQFADKHLKSAKYFNLFVYSYSNMTPATKKEEGWLTGEDQRRERRRYLCKLKRNKYEEK